MDLPSLNELLSPAGQELLTVVRERKPKEVDYLAHFQVLSRHYPAHLVQTALEVVIQRERAAAKFPFADRMYFDRESLEQSSSYPVASYRSKRYLEYKPVLDLGCSAGGDTLALAEIGTVTGIDIDPLRLALARYNLSALGLDERASWLQADLTQLPFKLGNLGKQAALFFDPARRLQGQRLFSVDAYHPPLSIIRDWLFHVQQLGVKLSPGVSLDELSPYEDLYEPEIEFISLDGELKEAVSWFGAFRSAFRRATLLVTSPRDDSHTVSTFQPSPITSQVEFHTLPLDREQTLPQLPLSPPQDYIYEPDPAVLRAGLVTLLGSMVQGSQLDPDIAYLTASQLTSTPFARCWAIQDWFPFQLKRLRAYLRSRRVGKITIKKRGSPLDPQVLARQLRLKGDEQALIFLTHLDGKPIVIVAAS